MKNDTKTPANDGHLSDSEQKELLRLARDTITHYLAGGEVLPYRTSNPRLLEPAAVFVTLRLRDEAGDTESPDEDNRPGALRGCIGQIEADEPLFAAVQDAAIKAATVDPRFYPVSPVEVSQLSIEISVLSSMRPVLGLSEIEVGRDGLFITGNRRRGLLLPEVPVNLGWGREEFLRALCHKAGLPEDIWPGSARLYAFSTESFED